MLFLCLLVSLKETDIANYANEYPGVCDIARVESPVTKQNAQEAFDFLMGIKVIGLLLGKLDENGEGIGVDRQKDVGRLIFFLADQPSSVLGELESQYSDRQFDLLRAVPSNEGDAS